MPQMIAVNAEETTINGKEAELRALLQKGLNIQEIDRELEKLAEKDDKLVQELQKNAERIETQKQDMKSVKEKAGKVLRSYYTGDRPSLLQVILTTESLNDLFKTLDYMNMIITHDSRVLSSYKSSQQKLQALHQQLSDQRKELEQTKADYIAQKTRVIALQAELDAILAVSDNKEQLIEQIDALNDQWRSKGLPLFKRYLSELSKSMQNIAELLSTDNFKLSSLNTAVFEITDTQLNTFLRSKNALFEHLNFRFEDGFFMADGKQDDIEVSIKGTYTMDEDKIRFELTGLSFNKLDLPDTTIKDLNDQYNLGIDPSQVSSIFSAEAVTVEKGKLVIKLKMTL